MCHWSFLKLKNTLNNVTEKSCNTYVATRKKLLSKTNNVYLPAISKQSGKISYMWNNANKIVPHN